MVNMASLSRIVAIPHGSPGRRLSLDRRHSAGRKTRRQLTWARRRSRTAKPRGLQHSDLLDHSPNGEIERDIRHGAARQHIDRRKHNWAPTPAHRGREKRGLIALRVTRTGRYFSLSPEIRGSLAVASRLGQYPTRPLAGRDPLPAESLKTR